MIELLRRFMGPYRGKTIIAIVTKVVEVVFEILTPLVVARMIDVGVRQRDLDEVLHMGLALLAFAVVSYLFTLICQRLAAQVSQRMGTDIRNDLYAQVNRLSSVEVNRIGIPSLVTRVTNDVNQVQLAVAIGVRMLPRWPLLAVGSMLAALLIDVRLGLVFLVCMPTIVVVFFLVMRASIPYYRQMQEKLDKISLETREMLSGMRVIRAFRKVPEETGRGLDAVEEQTLVAVAVGRLSAILNPATFVVMNLGVVAVLWVGGLQVDAGDLTTGEVVAFVNYMTQTLISVSYLANLVVVLMRGHTSSLRILEVLDTQPSITDEGNVSLGIDENAPALELDDVSFVYEGAPVPALADVSLSLLSGQTLGVIGGTGSGKSTFAQLIPRLCDPSSGSVWAFGHDVRDYPFDELRSYVSMVPQHVVLVSGTIRSNLLWRDPSACDDELWRALERAQAAKFVRMLPQGLDAPVEAGGTNFSGGQRQRLTIARALVGHPRLVVLDDAASALDFATDYRLRSVLRKLRAELTTIVISQRVSSIMSSDQILVLDHGAVAGLGTHDQLLEHCEIYREICVSQLGEEVMSRG